VGQAVGGECSSPIGLQPALLLHQSAPSNPTLHLLPALKKVAKNAQTLHILKMATAMLAETFDNFQHSTRLIPESRSCTLNSSRENRRTRYVHNIEEKDLESNSSTGW
jgi:hypothetical protein